MATAGRSYNDAIDALNSLQTPYEVVEARRKAGIRPDASSMHEIRTYLRRIGYAPADLNRLNIVHVAGTKGKGSTCAFVESILSRYRRAHGTPRRTGLLTSPHLVAVRERIRIDAAPISEALFARYFFEVWDLLGSPPAPRGGPAAGEDPAVPLGTRPAYARYLTLMSWHVFLREGVDVAVYETGIGGEYDATNVVERPVATGISTLGIDHVFALGDTVEKIAWHKSGIMKKGSPAFTISQLPGAAEVLRNRATEKGVRLEELDVDPQLKSVKIRPNAHFQQKNATLAVALARAALKGIGVGGMDSPTLPSEFVAGLEGVVFRGRCEVKTEDKVVWHIDGAHTADSLKVSTTWFADEIAHRIGPKILIFNQQGRTEAIDFLPSIHDALKRPGNRPAFDHVVFCTNVTHASTGYERAFVNRQHDQGEIDAMTLQRRFAEKWAALDSQADVRVLPTIEQAIEYARGVSSGLLEGQSVQVLVTGSLHLVGGALAILEGTDAL